MMQHNEGRGKKKSKKKGNNQDILRSLHQSLAPITRAFVRLLETLIAAVGMNSKPKIIDLTKKFGTAETLTEARVNCALEEKVRSLVRFISSLDMDTLLY